jgi:3-dehydroquinate synthase
MKKMVANRSHEGSSNVFDSSLKQSRVLERFTFLISRVMEKCEIVIGEGILPEISSFVLPHLGYPSERNSHREEDEHSVAIISDSRVSKIYGKTLTDSFSKIHTRPPTLISFPFGEASKTLETAARITSKLSTIGMDRQSCLLALGGGVVGDLAGFVASIYKRGVAYYQVPTTLLAQVDSSIGGKTAVNTEWGKNQLGTFYQPKGVFIDTYTLETLPKEEVMNGVSEMIKYGVVADKEMFWQLFKHETFYDTSEIKKFIPRCCKIKAKIVSEDEREHGLRSALNYGHTIGHVLEAYSGYSLAHGIAVALGMIAEGWISKELGIFDSNEAIQQEELLRRFLSDAGQKRKIFATLGSIKKSRAISLALSDKKSIQRKIRMSLPERIGRIHFEQKENSYTISVPSNIYISSFRYLEGLVRSTIIKNHN